MSDLATRTLAPLVLATSRKLGVELPKPVAEAIATADRLRSARRDAVVPAAPDLAAATAIALLADKNPLDSKDVQRALLARQYETVNIGALLESHAHQIAAEAILEHAGAVIETWRPTVERADQALQEFRDLAPAADLTDNNLASSLPAHALTPWGRARESVALLTHLEQGWQAIAAAANVRVLPSERPLIVAALSTAQLAQLAQLGDRPGCDAAARLGVPLELADLATYAERAARLVGERQDQADYEAAAPERRREERRRVMGVLRVPSGAA
jgi:hypothetical protein